VVFVKIFDAPIGPVGALFKANGKYYVSGVDYGRKYITLVETDLSSATVVQRYPIPGDAFRAWVVAERIGIPFTYKAIVARGDGCPKTVSVYTVTASPQGLGVRLEREFVAPTNAQPESLSDGGYPLMRDNHCQDKNKLIEMDLEKGTWREVGAYGPPGYDLWPDTVWSGETSIGSGKFLLSAHHYWMVGSFAFLHVVDLSTGRGQSFTQYDSGSGSFSAGGKLIIPGVGRYAVFWGRSGGVGLASKMYWFSKPFDSPDRYFDFRQLYPHDNLKTFAPYKYANGKLKFFYYWEVYPNDAYAGIGELDLSTGAVRKVEEAHTGLPLVDVDDCMMGYDPEAKKTVLACSNFNGTLTVMAVDEEPTPIGLTLMGPFVLLRNGAVDVIAYNRVFKYTCPSGDKDDSDCETVKTWAPPTPPLPTIPLWAWILLIVAIVAIVAVTVAVSRKK